MTEQSHTAEPVRPTGSWTAYPSLLQSLSPGAQTVLEEVACAHYCGRYHDGIQAFKTRLPPSHSNILISLQKADMLTSQGTETARLELLEEAAQTLNSKCNASEQLLLQFMLADAQFWTTGKPMPLAQMIPRVRSHVRGIGIQNVSDVEFRLITLYYDTVENLQEICNFVNADHRTIFPDSQGNRSRELRNIREDLQRRQHWRLVPTALQLELKHCPPGIGMRDLVTESSEYAKTLDGCKSPPLRFRSVILRKTISELLASIVPTWSAMERQAYLATLQELKDAAFGHQYPSWDQFAPGIAFDNLKSAILVAELPEATKIAELLRLGQLAQQRSDNTKTNQAFIAARDKAKANYEEVKGTESGPAAGEKLRSVQLEMVKFHRETTKMLYFEAFFLNDYLSTLFLRYHDYDGILKEVDNFEHLHPEFAVPGIQARLYNSASTAARARGYKDRLSECEKKHRKWLVLSQVRNQAGGFAAEAIMNPDYTVNFIEGSSNDPIQNGENAIRLMLLWSGQEIKNGLLSAQDCRERFHPGLDDCPDTRSHPATDVFLEYMNEKSDSSIATSIFGSSQAPRQTTEFMLTYNRLLTWTNKESSEHSNSVWASDQETAFLSSRLFTLRIFLQARLHMLRIHLGLDTMRREPNVNDFVEYKQEFSALQELKQMESLHNGVTADTENQELQSAIHMTLFKCGVPSAVDDGLLDKGELLDRVEDCQELIKRFGNSNHRLFQYDAVTKLLALHWKLHQLFHEDLHAMLAPAREADALYVELRRSICSPNAATQLIAGVKMSESFLHRVHFDLALAATFTLMRAHSGNEGEKQYQDQFLFWTLKSKGLGITDLLDMEAKVEQAVKNTKTDGLDRGSSEEASPGREDFVESHADTAKAGKVIVESKEALEDQDILGSKLRADLETSMSLSMSSTLPDSTTVSVADIQNLLDDLEGDIVIVDFINLSYLTDPTLIAILYRKNTEPSMTTISGIKTKDILSWINNNIFRQGRRRDDPLTEADAYEHLMNLAPLLSPLANDSIKQGETVVLCPTQILNAIPIHAIPVDHVPFIERNPVVYCQSLSVLDRLIRRFRTHSQRTKNTCTVVLNPLPDYYESTNRVKDLAGELKAKFLHGLEHRSVDTIQAIQGASLFHYHGHVEYSPRSALDSKMLLYDPKPKRQMESSDSRLEGEVEEMLGGGGVVKPSRLAKKETVSAQSLFNVRLNPTALATIIGCGSGISSISTNDELLGFPTALFFAGATTVVSTLWPILDVDGADFALEFYKAIRFQTNDNNIQESAHSQDAQKRGGGLDKRSGEFSKFVDLARALQTAVLELRKSRMSKGATQPYHWAAFTLNGCWFLDDTILN